MNRFAANHPDDWEERLSCSNCGTRPAATLLNLSICLVCAGVLRCPRDPDEVSRAEIDEIARLGRENPLSVDQARSLYAKIAAKIGETDEWVERKVASVDRPTERPENHYG